jgi:4,5-dihydroxyphthalate decarboxylase
VTGDGPLELELSTARYDRIWPLVDGRVEPEGIRLRYVPSSINELFIRQLSDKPFDVSEMSLSNMITRTSRGIAGLVALPIITSRAFRHSGILVRSDSGIDKPDDLVGRRVGVRDYTMTAALFIRGMLEHQYDVRPTQIEWYWGGLNQPSNDQLRVAFQPPPGLSLTWIGPNRSLAEMILHDELDALVLAEPPRIWLEGTPKLRRLFPAYRAESIQYFRETGIVPIMHLVVVREEHYRSHPWIARSLFDAFLASRDMCLAELADFGALRATLLFLEAELEEERQILGDDFWPYGLAANRTTLEAAIQFAVEQGLSDRQFDPEELFVPELRGT